MHISVSYSALLASLALVLTASAQECPGALVPNYAQPVFAAGWQGNLIAKGLSRPRGMQLDSLGNLLVVQQGVGIVHLQFTDGGGTCLTLAKQTTLITDNSVSIIIIHTEKLCLFRQGSCQCLVYLSVCLLFCLWLSLSRFIYSLGTELTTLSSSIMELASLGMARRYMHLQSMPPSHGHMMLRHLPWAQSRLLSLE